MSRLERIIGTNVVYCGNEEIRLGQTWYEVDVLESILTMEKPENFIEIGVHEGGLSYLLIPAHANIHYLGIELENMVVRRSVIQIYSAFHQTLLFEDSQSAKVLERVHALPHKMIYCDGGNKNAELMAYKRTCQPGDLIFVHDYHDGKRVVREFPVGHAVHAEVHPQDVEHMRSGFTPYSEGYLKETRIMGWRKE